MAVLTLNRGLVTSPNELTRPDGAAVVLDNCNIDFDNIVEPRRGFSEFGNQTENEEIIKQLLVYKGRVLRHFDNKISFDSTGNGTFLNFDGSYLELIDRLRIKYFELNSNLYFTTNEGVKKISARTADDFTTSANFITNAGGVKAVGLEGRIIPSASGFLPAQSKVAYKVLWAKKDINNNVVRGVPSSRYVITNNSLDVNVGEKFSIQVTEAGAGIHKSFDSTSSISGTTTGDTITIVSHGFANLTKVKLFGDIPKELDPDKTYYIRLVNTDSFKLSETEAGAFIVMTKKVGTSNIYSGILGSQFFTFDTPVSKFAVYFNISGDDPTPTDASILGRTLIEVPLSTVSTKNNITYAAKIAEVLFTISDISVSIATNKVTVTNKDGGNVFDSSQGDINASLLIVSKIIDGQTTAGTPANVSLTITVPSEIVSKDYFYEIYRTSAVSVQFGITLSDIDPGEEFQKVYEAPVALNSDPIPAEITIEDIVPESFREGGAYLYVNPVTGEGILQANEAPPISHDLAVFKGSAFYANTKERHRKQFNLLSVSQFPKTVSYNFNSTSDVSGNIINIPEHDLNNGNAIKFTGTPPIGLQINEIYYVVNATYDNDGVGLTIQVSTSVGGTPIALSANLGTCTVSTDPAKLYIGGSNTLREYTFIGRNEILKFTANKKSDTVGGSYYDIPSAQNRVTYRVWFDKGTISNTFNSTSDVDLNTITISGGHLFANNDIVTFSGTSPSGITNGTGYYVINKTDTTFQISTSIGGSAVTLGDVVGTATVTHTSVSPAQNSSILLKVILEVADNTALASAVAFYEAFINVVDFSVKAPTTNEVFVKLADNGYLDSVTSSTPPSGWSNVVVVQQGLGEDAASYEVLLSGIASQGLSIEDTARSLVKVINKDTLSPVNAFYLSGLNDLPGIILLESRSLEDTPFYIGFSHPTPTSIFEPSLPVVKTIVSVTTASPEAIIETALPHSLSAGEEVYAFIDPTVGSPILSRSGVVSNTHAPSTIQLSISGFTSASTLSSFDKAILFTTEVRSDNSINPNRVYFSKINQPEAVPLVNYIDIGPKDKAIQRILALRDSLIVLKEDGVYVITGASAPNFSVRLSDSSALTFAPDTATNLNNLIYVLTTQGVVTVSETGVGVISRSIENKIQEVTNSKFNYKLVSWGMSSESDRAYFLWLPEKTNNTYAMQAFRYNTFTRTWTRWTKPANCGVINPINDKIYLGDASGRPFVLQERKNFERQDYADRDFLRSIPSAAISGTTYKLSSVQDIEVGDVLTQEQYLDINKFNRFLKKLVRDNFSLSQFDFTIFSASIGDNLATKLLSVAQKLQDEGISVPLPSGLNVAITIGNEFNDIINYLNTPTSGTNLKNYKRADELLVYEVLITGVDIRNNTITIKNVDKFLEGTVRIFKGIKSIVEYAPQHFGKPEMTKQIAEGTFIFDQNNFWGGTIAYASDRSYDFAQVNFSFRGPGYWNGYSWAEVTFGGGGNETPVRTLIPRDKARCRYLHIQFTHVNAREQWKLVGVSLEPREISTRGYR